MIDRRRPALLVATLALFASAGSAAAAPDDGYRTIEVLPGVKWSRTVDTILSADSARFHAEYGAASEVATTGRLRVPIDILLVIEGSKASDAQLAWANANDVALELDCSKQVPRARHLVCFSYPNVNFAALAANPELETLVVIGGAPTKLLKLRQLQKLRRLEIHTTITDAMIAEVAKLTNLQHLALERREVTDRHLAQLRALTELLSLNLSSTNITDAGLVHLRAFPKLQSLRMGAVSSGEKDGVATPNLTAAGLEIVGTLTQLRALDLYASPSGEGLLHLAKLTQLEAFIGPNKVNDDGMAVLANFTKLRVLKQWGFGVTDRSATHLKPLPLQLLDVKYTKLGDKAASVIGSLSRLEELGAPRGLGDPGMKHLARLAKLRRIDLCDTQITDVGVALLPRASALEFVNICNNGERITLISAASLAKLPKLSEVVAGGTRFEYKGCPALRAKIGREVCSQ